MRINRNYRKVEYPLGNEFGIERAYVRQPSLVDEFYITENKCPASGVTTHQISHPLYMLFNQERLNRLGSEAVRQWLESLDRSGNSQLNELRKKCSDDDLLAMTKSRYIQHPCELEAYINALNKRAEFFNAEVAKIVAEENQAKEQQMQQVEQSKDIQV